jgi:hypothetical protein
MSFVTSSSLLAPQIITQDLFPNIYALDIPDAIFDDTYDIVPNMYQYGLPSIITQGRDPAYVTGPQKYEYKYTNSNGIDIVLRGTYTDVVSTIDVLNTYPPIKKDFTQTGKREYLELYGPGSQPKNIPTVPIVGAINNGKYIYLKMDGKTFSGSGSLIMVVETGKPVTDAKIILFRDKHNSYQDLGGKIDKPLPNVVIDKDFLFKNAKKESEEESMKLFSLTNPSLSFVDIESTADNTFYRVYLYLFTINNINQLETMYESNKLRILTDFPHNFDESYKETNKLALFDYNTFISKIAIYNPNLYNTTSGIFQTVSNEQVKVRGRTMRVIAKLQTENKFADMINNMLTNVSVSRANNSILFNTITL